MKNHSFGLDLVRSSALFLVIMVHSFLYSGFNTSNLIGIKMFFLLFIRCICFSGVLLFVILTGYLKQNKKIDKNHYKSIIKILIIYFVISIFTLIYRKLIINDNTSLYDLFIGIFNFTTISYSWYVEMYIGLFLIIPFLNILYKNIENKKQKQLLIIILLIISSLFPTISRIKINSYSLNIFPDYWQFLYPILLYYVGCYIKEYQIHINKLINICIITLLVFLQTFILFFYVDGNYIGSISIVENSFLPIITSFLLFILLYDVKTYSKRIFTFVNFISKFSFGAYLISYTIDNIVYRLLYSLNISGTLFFFISTIFITPIIYGISITISYIITKFVNLIETIIKNNIKKRKEKYKNYVEY